MTFIKLFGMSVVHCNLTRGRARASSAVALAVVHIAAMSRDWFKLASQLLAHGNFDSGAPRGNFSSP